jgi:hypothetical protein
MSRRLVSRGANNLARYLPPSDFSSKSPVEGTTFIFRYIIDKTARSNSYKPSLFMDFHIMRASLNHFRDQES